MSFLFMDGRRLSALENSVDFFKGNSINPVCYNKNEFITVDFPSVCNFMLELDSCAIEVIA